MPLIDWLYGIQEIAENQRSHFKLIREELIFRTQHLTSE